MRASGPDILIYPPVVSIVAPVAAVALEWIAPLSVLPPPGALITLVPGVACLLAALWLERGSRVAFEAEDTNIDPHKEALALVETGPYRFSRNPMYLGMITLQLGLALTFSLDWGLLIVPLLFAVFHFGVVLREEAYLIERFGTPYQDYLNRTRRWL